MLKRGHTAVLETQNKNVFSIIDPVMKTGTDHGLGDCWSDRTYDLVDSLNNKRSLLCPEEHELHWQMCLTILFKEETIAVLVSTPTMIIGST
jgi:hypothetical protein